MRAATRGDDRHAGTGVLGTWVVLACAVTWALVAGDALAATYYVRADGSDANSGTGNSSTAAWRTIGKANAVLRAGDAVNVVSLNPADTTSSSLNVIAPSSSGTATAPILYLGDPTAPELLSVPAIMLTRSYITVIGFRAQNGGTIAYSGSVPTNCVVDHCVMQGTFQFQGSVHSRLSHGVLRMNVLDGTSLSIGSSAPGDTTYPASFDTVRANAILLGTILPGPFARCVRIQDAAQDCVVDSNQVSGVMDNTANGLGDETYAFVLYEAIRCQFRHNKAVYEVRTPGYEANPSGTAWNALVLRNGAHGNSFYADTVITIGANPDYQARINLGQSSDPPPAWGITPGPFDNHWDRCVYEVSGWINFYDGMINCSVDSSIFVSRNLAPLGTHDIQGSSLRNNTFVNLGTNKVLDLDTYSDVLSPGTVIQNNIFYTQAATHDDYGIFSMAGAAGYANLSAGNLVSDYNLFYSPSGTSSDVVVWKDSTGTKHQQGIGTGTAWNSLVGNDGHSRWSDPLFTSLTWGDLDFTLRPGSPAIGNGWGGGDIGAVTYTVDTTAPAAVSDLSAIEVSDQNVAIGWTAPGDDGNVGTANSYELRWSTSPIDATNFSSATAVSPEPVPAAAGTRQSYVLGGRTPGQTYYFAIIAHDEAGNTSPLSNVLRVTMATSDQVAPSNVTDLSAGQ